MEEQKFCSAKIEAHVQPFHNNKKKKGKKLSTLNQTWQNW